MYTHIYIQRATILVKAKDIHNMVTMFINFVAFIEYCCLYKQLQSLQETMETTETFETTVRPYKFSINVKVNAKREVYGEFKVNADNIEELRQGLKDVKALFYNELQ